jgi:hypothetical protein
LSGGCQVAAFVAGGEVLAALEDEKIPKVFKVAAARTTVGQHADVSARLTLRSSSLVLSACCRSW